MLQLNVRTIYENAKRLGGFYPAGIRVLRFKEGVIRGIMEGPGNRVMEVPVSASGEALRRRRIQHQGGSADGQGRPPEASIGGGGKTKAGDPDDPYGVLALSRSLPPTKRTTARRQDV
jgi:hypothetical protein